MSRWGRVAPTTRVRTQAERNLDAITFCASARIERVVKDSAEAIAKRYGTTIRLADYHRSMRLQGEGRA